MNDNFVRRNLKRRFKGTYKKKRKTNKGGGDGVSETFTGKKGTGSSYAYHIERNDNSNMLQGISMHPACGCLGRLPWHLC